MRDDQTQLFKMEYDTRCDTFGCGERGTFMVGRPDGPLNTSHVLCQVCTDSLITSVHELLVDEALFSSNVEVPEIVEFDPREIDVETDIQESPGVAVRVEDAVSEAKTHAELDKIAQDLGLKGIPSRDNAKLQQRKEAILAALAK